jgi:hypothetical protein
MMPARFRQLNRHEDSVHCRCDLQETCNNMLHRHLLSPSLECSLSPITTMSPSRANERRCLVSEAAETPAKTLGRRGLLAALAIAISSLGVSRAAAETSFFSPGFCQPFPGVDNSLLSYSWAGLLNIGNEDAGLNCPMAWTSSGTVTAGYVYMRYLDGSDDGAVRCRHTGQDSFQNLYLGSYRYSCSSWGGCTTPTTSYVSTFGTGDPMDVLALPPAFGTIYNNAANITVYCSLPADDIEYSSLNGCWRSRRNAEFWTG